MRELCTYLAVVLLTMVPAAALGQAVDADFVPERGQKWRARSQFAGFQGLLSAGAGPLWVKGHWRPALMYGFAPPQAGRDAVHQVILRNDVVFGAGAREAGRAISPVLSVNMLLETGRHSYLHLPDKYPAGYYMAPMPRFTLGAGGRMERRIGGRSFAIAAELVGMDAYLWYAMSERGFPLHAALGLSFGVEYLW